jgi:hypothetical protein
MNTVKIQSDYHIIRRSHKEVSVKKKIAQPYPFNGHGRLLEASFGNRRPLPGGRAYATAAAGLALSRWPSGVRAAQGPGRRAQGRSRARSRRAEAAAAGTRPYGATCRLEAGRPRGAPTAARGRWCLLGS